MTYPANPPNKNFTPFGMVLGAPSDCPIVTNESMNEAGSTFL